MPAALGRRFTYVSLLLLGGAGTTPAQSVGTEPLRKTDLVRLLSVGTLGPGEPRVVPRLPLSAALTGFVQGGGQRGSVGTRPRVPVVFQVRDTSGAPVGGEAVTFRVTNGQLGASRAVTDSTGSVKVDLTLGP